MTTEVYCVAQKAKNSTPFDSAIYTKLSWQVLSALVVLVSINQFLKRAPPHPLLGDSVTFNTRQIEKRSIFRSMSFKDSLTVELPNILNSNKSQKMPNVSAASTLQIILEREEAPSTEEVFKALKWH